MSEFKETVSTQTQRLLQTCNIILILSKTITEHYPWCSGRGASTVHIRTFMWNSLCFVEHQSDTLWTTNTLTPTNIWLSSSVWKSAFIPGSHDSAAPIGCDGNIQIFAPFPVQCNDARLRYHWCINNFSIRLRSTALDHCSVCAEFERVTEHVQDGSLLPSSAEKCDSFRM